MSRQRLIIITIGALVGTLIFLLVFSFIKSQAPAVTIDEIVPENGLTIANITKSANGISTYQQQAIATSVYENIGKKGNFTGKIREGSFKQYTDGDYTYVKFLVDIPTLKHTYKVTAAIAGPDDYRAIEVLCPDKNELIYGSFSCKDIRDA